MRLSSFTSNRHAYVQTYLQRVVSTGITLVALLIILSAQTVSAQGTLWVHTNTLDFGNKVTTETGANIVNLYLSNPGPGTLTFSGPGIYIEGPDAADFTLTDEVTTAPRIAQGASSRAIPIAFKPATPGWKTASLIITTSDPENTTETITLTGTGVPYRATIALGNYHGYGPGISTIGTGGDYESLYDATAAISSHPLTGGDWTFLILNSLDEPNSCFIGQFNTNGHTITIRPAPNTNPEITFTSTTNNVQSNLVDGHINVGALIDRRFPSGGVRDNHEPTRGITIDGCNTPGGTNQNLTFKNIESSAGGLALINCVGDSDYIVIKNCRLHSHPQTGTRSVKSIVNFFGFPKTADFQVAPSGVPDYCTISNCDIQTTGVSPFAISVNAGMFSASLTTPSLGINIIGNSIRTRYFGIDIDYAADARISSNTIAIDPNPFSMVHDNYGLAAISYGSVKTNAPWTSEITGNRIEFTSTQPSTLGLAGIRFFYSNRASYLIANNSITGLGSPPAQYPNATRYGIYAAPNAESTVTLLHNSIAMHGNQDAAVTTASRAAGIALYSTHTSMTSTIRNNIVYTSLPNSAGIFVAGVNDTIDSNYNNLAADNEGLVGATMPSLATGTTNGYFGTIADWRTSTGLDLNSISQNPFVPVAPGLGAWIGPENTATPDLHFTSHPGALYQAPTFSGITTDIDGELRFGSHATMGADEAPPITSAVNSWELY